MTQIESNIEMEDEALLQRAEELFAVEKLLQAAQLLEQVQDKSLLQEKHHWMLRWAKIIEEGMKDLKISPSAEGTDWKKQSESHGHRDFTVYYQVNDENHLTCRIDSVVESSLLVPIISVFNESDLYDTWMPSYQRPFKLGVESSEKLKETGRGNQIIRVKVNMAWPFSPREVTQHAVAVDAIEEEEAVAIQVLSETHEENADIPLPTPGAVSVDLSASMLLRGCPSDHPLLAHSKHKYPEGEGLILISIKSFVDAHVTGIPLSAINFVSRTVFSRLWSALLNVAEGVKEGKRSAHQQAIENNRELYDWVEERIKVLIEKVQQGAA